MKHEIRYGKAEISVYRTYARPLRRVRPIPESTFAGRTNTLFGAEVTVDVYGDNFLASYTEGDNSDVVATDTMKNFTYASALEFQGATQEAFAGFLARSFLETYPQMERVRVRARELPFVQHSDKLLSPSFEDHGFVEVELTRNGVHRLSCGRHGLKLVKLTGSSFAAFHRDRFTTLPEVQDRPLYIYLDTDWTYADPSAALEGEPGDEYVPSEQVADLLRATFDEFVSLSIQHLVHEMGERMLERFPSLSEVSFDAQNRLWDTSAAAEGEGTGAAKVKVYSNPKPAHGSIGLRMKRG